MTDNSKEVLDNEKPFKRSIIKRLTMIVVLLIAVFHLFATFLWIAPNSEARNVFPDNGLRNYMTPFFTQGWSVFAPNPVNSDFYFDVRATVVDENGDERTTGWVRSTDVEIDHDKYSMFSPRSIRMGLKVSTDVKRSWNNLTSSQKEIVEQDFLNVDDYTALEDILNEGNENSGYVNTYIRSDETATAYATQVALAVFGDDVVKVQYRASEQRVVPFSDRNDEDAVRPDVMFSSTGWRGLLIKPGQDNEKFKEYFCNSDEVRCVR